MLPSEAQRPPTCSAAGPGLPSTVRPQGQPADPAQPEREFLLVYVRRGPLEGPLAAKYSSPYHVLEQRGQVLLLQMGERADWVSMDRVKPHKGLAVAEPAQPPQLGLPRKEPPGDSRD